jgi:hypothetical protein
MSYDMMFPFANDFSQILVYKIMLLWKNEHAAFKGAAGSGRSDVDALLPYIESIACFTRGLPQKPILVGFQEGGHDFSYPRFGPVDRRIHSSGHPGLAPAEALNNMMRQARERYGATCSVHVNFWEGYEDSEWFARYKDNDLLSKDEQGEYIRGWYDEANQRRAYQINIVAEWEKGYLQKRIDDLFETLPELKYAHFLYNDANCGYFCSPYHHASTQDFLAVFQKLIRYIREKYGADMTGEVCITEQYGFIAHTLTLEWSAGGLFYSVGDTVEPMKLAPYLICGGRPGESLASQLYGGSVQFEHDIYHTDYREAQKQFCLNTLPYFFLNSKLRLKFDRASKTALFSDRVRSFIFSGSESSLSPHFADRLVEDEQIITCGDSIVRAGDDLFVPVVWRGKEIMAYSLRGCTRRWTLPDLFGDVDKIDVYALTPDGLQLKDASVDVSDGTLTLTLAENSAVTIVPAGTDTGANTLAVPAGQARHVKTDARTGGYWKGQYGLLGYEIYGGSSLPFPGLTYVGCEDALLPCDASPLRSPDGKRGRFYPKSFIVKTAELHFLIDVHFEKKQRLSLYLVDGDGASRTTLVEAIDPGARKILDYTVAADYENGQYVSFDLAGHVQIRLTRLFGNSMRFGGPPALAGVFLDAVVSEP